MPAPLGLSFLIPKMEMIVAPHRITGIGNEIKLIGGGTPCLTQSPCHCGTAVPGLLAAEVSSSVRLGPEFDRPVS